MRYWHSVTGTAATQSSQTSTPLCHLFYEYFSIKSTSNIIYLQSERARTRDLFKCDCELNYEVVRYSILKPNPDMDVINNFMILLWICPDSRSKRHLIELFHNDIASCNMPYDCVSWNRANKCNAEVIKTEIFFWLTLSKYCFIYNKYLVNYGR